MRPARAAMAATATVLLSAAVAACGSGSGARASSAPTLSRNGVTVTLRYRPTPQAGPGTGQLIATFRPEQAGFHVYSKDLPPAGISGVGYPTRARPTSGLTPTGVPSASVDPVPLVVQSVGLTLPVYPDGPVTLTEPVRLVNAHAATSTVLVSYAACSNSLCLRPVVDQPVAIALAQA